MPTRTDSLYEQLFPQTTVMKQRFVENFLGKLGGVNERWNLLEETGTPFMDLSTQINRGIFMILNTPDFRGVINFNNIRQFNEDGSVIIVNGSRITVADELQWIFGLINTNGAIEAGGSGFAAGANDSDNTFKRLTSSDGTGITGVDTSIAIDDDVQTTWKLELQASNLLLSLDGVLEAEKTDELPTDKLQPAMQGRSRGFGTKTCYFGYCEAYNT